MSKESSKGGKPNKLGVKSDTFTQVSDSEAQNVKGGSGLPGTPGIIPKTPGFVGPGSMRKTLNPTSENGCCDA